MKLSAAALVFGLSLGITAIAAAAPFNDRGQRLPTPSAQGTSTQPAAQGSSMQVDTMQQHGFNDRGKLKPNTALNNDGASQLPASTTNRMPIAPARGFKDK